LLIVHGGGEPKEYPIEVDEAYEKELWTRVAAFQLNVMLMTPPSELPKMVPPEKWRTVDLSDEYSSDWPNWGQDMREFLQVWAETADAHTLHTDAAGSAKKLMPDDVGRVEADGVLMVRNKINSITIKDMRRR
jgi:hypothetical protein